MEVTVPEQRSSKRRSHAAANDAVLHDASIEMLASGGLDLFTFSDLAKSAGLTRAPIYSRYDSPDDVAVELWNDSLVDELDRLLALSSDWFLSDDSEPSRVFLRAITRPTEATSALIEVMAVSRRSPSLFELVQTTLDDRLSGYVDAQSCPRSLAVAQVTVLMGTLFLAPFIGPRVVDGWSRPMQLLREMVRDEDSWSVAKVESTALQLPIVGPSVGDEVLDGFIPAIFRVISRVGYEHATANRIGREAGRTFNMLYERFDSKDALMAYVVSRWVASGVQLAFRPFVGITPTQYLQQSVTMGASLVAPINRPFRNLRNEMTLAARHHRTIGSDAAKQYRSAARDGRRLMESTYAGVTDEIYGSVGDIGSLVRSNGFGISLLAACTPWLTDLDWTAASSALQRILWSRVFDRLRLRVD